MASVVVTNNPTVASFANGIAGVAANGSVYRTLLTGAWNVFDNVVLNLVTTAASYTCGAGRVTGTVPTQAITLYDRVQMLADTRWFGSDNGDSTAWEQQAPGAFFFQISNQVTMPEDLVSLAPYQGMIALFSRRTTQLWVLDPNPINISIFQVLSNIGTFAPNGPCALGDIDIIFPYDSGIRSIRARVSSLNAISNDIGSAVDALFQDTTVVLTQNELAQCCSIVEPGEDRYWTFVPGHSGAQGTIYVLSYFPSNKITGWSQYSPTYSVGGIQTQFTPQKFIVYQGQVYVCDANAIYLFGGTNNLTYDGVVATIQVPFYDEKRPGHEKDALAVDVDVTGNWTISGSMNWINETWDGITPMGQATFDQGNVPFQERGTHFSFLLTSTGNPGTSTITPVVSSIIFYYNLGAEQKN